jgi:hypothetical protein
VLYRRQRLNFFSSLLHIRGKARHALLYLQDIAQLIKCVILIRLFSGARSSIAGGTEARHITLHLYGPAATAQQGIHRRLEAPAFLQVVDLPKVCVYIRTKRENIHVISCIFRVPIEMGAC